MAGPLAVPGGMVLVVSASFAQAKTVFGDVVNYLRPIFEAEPERWRVLDSTSTAHIEDRLTGSALRCIGSDPARAHGYRSLYAILDEPNDWPPVWADKLYTSLRSGLGKLPGSRLIALGTRAGAGHWFDRLCGGKADYCQVHSAKPDADVLDADAWLAGNPSLPFMPDLRQTVAKEAAAAAADPALVPSFRARRLNTGGGDTVEDVLVTDAAWQRCVQGEQAERDGGCAVGIDIGGSTSMTTAAVLWPLTGRLELYAGLPAVPAIAERERLDQVPADTYARMIRRGELRLFAGETTPVPAFLRSLLEVLGGEDVLVCGADRYKRRETLAYFREAGVAWSMRWRGVGAGQTADGSADIRSFQRRVIERRVSCQPSLLMQFALAETRLSFDAGGNPRIDKRRHRSRVDVSSAVVIAAGLADGVEADEAAAVDPLDLIALPP